MERKEAYKSCGQKKVRLKDKEVISESSCDIVCKLIKFGVLAEHVDGVLYTIAKGLGIAIEDHVSARSVSWIILEGGGCCKAMAHIGDTEH